MDLFSKSPHLPPLAERIRPEEMDQIIGQRHLLEEGNPLQQMIERGAPVSMIFWGPPGVGKTTLARIIAKKTGRPFRQLSAVESGVKDVREVLAFARSRPGTILFIDEIHRFNKSQQDSMLGAVESGIIVLIGATTENPSFEVNAALLSRCQVYRLESLDQEELKELVEYAISTDKVLKEREFELKELDAIYKIAAGDARKSLRLLEMVEQTVREGKIVITNELVTSIAQERIALYDKDGEQHYDIISAFIKSVRGGDPNGAVYWLARMLEGGEDIKFIARRLIILASEDIGNANPNALMLANSCFQAINVIGMPEARIILSQVTTYLATSVKSNAAYAAINTAMAVVKNSPDYPVPLHLRNAPTRMMKDMGYGKDYKYTHDLSGEEARQEYLPEELKGKTFYQPKDIGREKDIRKFIEAFWGDHYPL